MANNHHLPWDKLAKYFAGELYGEDLRSLEAMIENDPVFEETVAHLQKIWEESGELPVPIETEEAWQMLSSSMEKSEQQVSESANSDKNIRLSSIERKNYNFRKSHNTQRRIVLAAALVLLTVTIGYIASSYNQDVRNASVAEIDYRVIETRYGERASYVLSDGSRITLHGGSKIKIPENYNQALREIYLEGEAYFETVYDSEKPFKVHSLHSYVNVLGTKFLVQAWEEEITNIEVVVAQGKVLFGDSRSLDTDLIKEVELTKNQRAVLADNATLEAIEVDNIDWYLGWTEGRLVFEDRTLGEVIPRLERWYNLDIQVSDERIKEKRITAEIDYTLSMSEVLAGVAITFNLNMERDGRTIIFKNHENNS